MIGSNLSNSVCDPLLKFGTVAERRGEASKAAQWRKDAYAIQQAIEREAWEAWESSKGERRSTRTRQRTLPNGISAASPLPPVNPEDMASLLRFPGAEGHLRDACDAGVLAEAIAWAGETPAFLLASLVSFRQISRKSLGGEFAEIVLPVALAVAAERQQVVPRIDTG